MNKFSFPTYFIYTLLTLCVVACGKHDDESVDESVTEPPIVTVASLGTPADNEIWFTQSFERHITLDETAFNVTIEDIIYSNEEGGCNIIRFAGDVTTIGEKAFDGCFSITNISLPNSVKTIGANAFNNCTNLECLTLGSNIRTCGKRAFEGCDKLYSLHIPSIESWCNITFADQKANPLSTAEHLVVNGVVLSELVIPEGIEEVSPYAFYNGQQFNSVSIPKSVKRIGKYAFYQCNKIKKVDTASVSDWCKIDFENEEANPLSIAMVLYQNGVQISHVSLTSVGEIFNFTFINCTNIQSFSADDNFRSIGSNAFRNCSALTTVSLGRGMEYIGEQAFWNCTALTSVTCRAIFPPMLGDDDVFNKNGNGRCFYVPSEALANYKSSWSDYADYIYALSN